MEVEQNFNAKFKQVFYTDARYIDVWGGRGRGGSHFGTDYFLFLITQPKYFRGYFMREVLGDIRNSLFQDFKDRLNDSSFDDTDFAINESAMTIKYLPTGNTITSKGFKKSSGTATAKLKSIAGATHILIEECEETNEDDFNKLDDSLRTVKAEKIQIIRLFNSPGKNHWLIKNNYDLVESDVEGFYMAVPKPNNNLLSIHTTYLDNIVNINASSIEKYESYKLTKPDYYYTMIKGLVSEGNVGRIYKNWKPIDKMPEEIESFYALDFGFSSDPLALLELKIHNDNVYINELIYESGLTNIQLAKRMHDLEISENDLIIADSSEPKSIQELVDGWEGVKDYENLRKGFNVVGVVKGPDSISFGINLMKGKNVFVTSSSKNVWFECQEYCWQLDRHKEPTDKPVDKNNHAMDAARYGAVHYYIEGISTGLQTSYVV